MDAADIGIIATGVSIGAVLAREILRRYRDKRPLPRFLEPKIQMSITLKYQDGEQDTYHYKGTGDELMEMLNHLPKVGSTYGDKIIDGFDSQIK